MPTRPRTKIGRPGEKLEKGIKCCSVLDDVSHFDGSNKATGETAVSSRPVWIRQFSKRTKAE